MMARACAGQENPDRSSSISSARSAMSALFLSIVPVPITWAKSRTRRRMRLAIRGVPRLRRRSRIRPRAQCLKRSRMPAERSTIRHSSSGVYSSRRRMTPKRSRSGAGKLAGACCRTDERKFRQVDEWSSRRRPLADDDVDGEVLHRGIKDLLDRTVRRWISSINKISFSERFVQ